MERNSPIQGHSSPVLGSEEEAQASLLSCLDEDTPSGAQTGSLSGSGIREPPSSSSEGSLPVGKSSENKAEFDVTYIKTCLLKKFPSFIKGNSQGRLKLTHPMADAPFFFKFDCFLSFLNDFSQLMEKGGGLPALLSLEGKHEQFKIIFLQLGDMNFLGQNCISSIHLSSNEEHTLGKLELVELIIFIFRVYIRARECLFQSYEKDILWQRWKESVLLMKSINDFRENRIGRDHILKALDQASC